MKFFRALFALIFSILLVGAGVVSPFVVNWLRHLPDYRELDSLTLGSTTKVYARDGSLVGILSPTMSNGGHINRTLVDLDQVSPYMQASVITAEDRRFFEHYGVDFLGILRGIYKTVKGERLEGGSTLTNQVVKNTLLTNLADKRTEPGGLQRKIQEWVLSIQVERSFTKEEVLNHYLNVIYWGRGGAVDILGVHGAARAYLGKLPRDLTLAESVYLTRLIPKPARYFDYKGMRGLMKSLLDDMVEDGWITAQERDEAWKEKMQPRGWKVTYDDKGNVLEARLVNEKAKNLPSVVTERAPHFLQQVERDLIAKFGREKVYGSGGLNVYTTLDPKAQDSAEKASMNAQIPPGATLAMVILDPYTGEILAMVGQKLKPGQVPVEWNNAAQGARQVGSSIKPLLYTTAIEQGITQDHTEFDEPTDFGNYKPQNFGGKYAYRDLSLRWSLDHSLNIPTLKLAKKVGLNNFMSKLRTMDLHAPDDVGLSLAIGTLETSPLKMAAAYAAFVNGGTWYRPSYIRRVEAQNGRTLYDSWRDRPEKRRVFSPQVAYVGLDMLMGVVNDLTPEQGNLAYKAKIPGWQVGGKTGTTNEQKDLWFVGVTPAAVGAVWVGRQEGGGMPANFYSGTVNPPIWQSMMAGYLAGKPPTTFAKPDGIVYRMVDGHQAAYVTERARKAVRPTGGDPTPVVYQSVEKPPEDYSTSMVAIDTRTGKLADEFTPPDRVKLRRVYGDLTGFMQ
ncbi:transglycosylase domain-containing protein [Deinococcus cellulosilyticus]|uniref:peptidoglycan glycosyltransferase n=1 Tax=Deinococcus cellulosilyticus (strain DSM 18568 / NBRC 106333 / KACC 11606 / 5516J-15) TaxID=1223518 RepID=A0A511N8M8_DEIC1|nr:transglycosylase domain-containing protein [Deinococcus cellulosilyticus]GEM48838.1 hypothetical protein DC3_44730 [Deinococcus cellulosilyticus NBRC 106333 = KACC 11606]